MKSNWTSKSTACKKAVLLRWLHEQTCKPSSVLPEGAAAIYLGHQLPGISSDSYPRDSAGNFISLLFSLAPGGVCLADRSPGRWCALTAPLHPYLLLMQKAVYFCGTFLGVAPTGYYPAPCPAELGLSSKVITPSRLPSLLMRLSFNNSLT